LTDARAGGLNGGMSSLPRFILDHRDEVAALCRVHHARRLELFGSATRPDFSAADSDLDFIVDMDEALPPGEYSKSFFALKAQLEGLFGRPVDLLTDASILNPFLRRRVDAERVAIYGA
jgi:uncharacterized protein